jgi:hypothetical protein
MTPGSLTPDVAQRLADLAEVTDRLPQTALVEQEQNFAA